MLDLKPEPLSLDDKWKPKESTVQKIAENHYRLHTKTSEKLMVQREVRSVEREEERCQSASPWCQNQKCLERV
jgi:hypothetical protein